MGQRHTIVKTVRGLNKISILKATDLINDEEFNIYKDKEITRRCPYISIRINNILYEMLINSGADISSISEKYQQLLLQDDVRMPTIPLTGLVVHISVRNKSTKVNTQMLLPISFHDKTINKPVIVIKDLNENRILESDFLEVCEATIDFV